MAQAICARYGSRLFYAAIAALIGLVVGILDAVFGRGLIWLNACRDQHPLYFMPFLGVVGIAIMTVYLRFGGRAQRGMALIFAVGYEEDEHIPIRMIPLTVIATWLTHLLAAAPDGKGWRSRLGRPLPTTSAMCCPYRSTLGCWSWQVWRPVLAGFSARRWRGRFCPGSAGGRLNFL